MPLFLCNDFPYFTSLARRASYHSGQKLTRSVVVLPTVPAIATRPEGRNTCPSQPRQRGMRSCPSLLPACSHRLWHRYALRHEVTKHDAIQPTYRTPGGINVFEQTEFKIPVAHRKCSCGKIWVNG